MKSSIATAAALAALTTPALAITTPVGIDWDNGIAGFETLADLPAPASMGANDAASRGNAANALSGPDGQWLSLSQSSGNQTGNGGIAVFDLGKVVDGGSISIVEASFNCIMGAAECVNYRESVDVMSACPTPPTASTFLPFRLWVPSATRRPNLGRTQPRSM